MNKCRMFLAVCLILSVVLTGCAGTQTASVTKAQSKTVHFSIDDATMILQDITLNGYDTIFEQNILSELKQMHDTWGIKCTLYLYEEIGDYNLSQMPPDYKEEFEQNADWLKLGFHGYNEENPEESGLDIVSFEQSYDAVCREIERFAGRESLTSTLRLHYWYGTEKMMDFLKVRDVKAVLCPDNGSAGYNLTEKENKELQDSLSGVWQKELTYYRTDIRYENIEDITQVLQEHAKDDVIVIFTHAWCFQENEEKIRESMEWFVANQYEFSFLEDGVAE